MARRLPHQPEPAKRIANRPARLDPWFLALLPTLGMLLIVFGLPIADLFYLSLHGMAGPAQIGDDLTFENYRAFAQDSLIAAVLARTIWLGLVVVGCCLLIAYPVAYLLARTSGRWRNPVLLVVTACMLISSVVRNLGWFPLLGESGLVNWLLLSLRLIHEPFQLVGKFPGVVIGLVHTQLPIMILTLTAVIQRIEPDLEEAARNLGAPPFETLWRIVLPLSLPGIIAGSLLCFTLTISAFTTPAILGGNSVLIMAIYIAQQFQTVLNYPAGASAAILLLVTAAVLTLIALRIRARGAAHQ
jgi:putative spermidine/putrescine transport system permease protein